MLRLVRAAAAPVLDWKETCVTVYPCCFYLRKGPIIVSGFFVSRTGLGVTCDHFFEQIQGEKTQNLQLWHQGLAYGVLVIHRNSEKDIAVVKVQGEKVSFPYLTLETEPLEVGTQVAVYGVNPMLKECFAPGYILDPAYNLMKTVKIPCVRSSCRADAGYSGGPVVTSAGKVIGLHKAGTGLFPGVLDSVSVPSAEVKTVLKSIAKETSSGWELR